MRTVAAMLALVAALAGFYGGFRVGQGQAATATTTTSKSPAAPQPKAGPAGQAQCSTTGSSLSGSVTQLTDAGFVIHNPLCNTDVNVTYGPSLVVRKTVTGQAADIQDSQTVTVQGQVQADGTVRAASVTVNPGGAAGSRGPRG